MKKTLILIPLLFVLLNVNNYSEARLGNLSISGGLTTLTIVDDNPAKMAIVPRDLDEDMPYLVGGGFNGPESGFTVRLHFDIDSDRKFEVPIAYDYIFFRSAEWFPVGRLTYFFLKHKMDMHTGSIGLNYYFERLSQANVRPFVGLALRGSYIPEGVFEQKVEYREWNEIKYYGHTPKKSAFRIGGELVVGFKGELWDPISINTQIGLNAINFMGREDERGELFTPIKADETSESIVYNLRFVLTIHYKF